MAIENCANCGETHIGHRKCPNEVVDGRWVNLGFMEVYGGYVVAKNKTAGDDRRVGVAEHTYIIRCDVTLKGATMYVKAASPEEALRKAYEGKWTNLEYAQAELTHWNITGEPKENT